MNKGLLAGARVIFILTMTLHTTRSAAIAQHVLAGMKVGGHVIAPLALPRYGSSTPTAYNAFTLGPVVELTLPHRAGVELDALHKSYAYTYAGGVDVGFYSPASGGILGKSDVHVRSWEFPALMKLRLTDRVSRLFMAGGISFRHTSASAHVQGNRFGPFYSQAPTPVDFTQSSRALIRRWTTGAVVGMGVNLRAGDFQFAPEVRYNYWTHPAISQGLGFRSQQNAIDVLVGLTFGKR